MRTVGGILLYYEPWKTSGPYSTAWRTTRSSGRRTPGSWTAPRRFAIWRRRITLCSSGRAYSDIHKIDERVYDINNGLCDFAEKGEWRGFVGILSGIVKENFAVRDAVEGEKVVQSTLVALLTAAKGPYLVSHERGAGDPAPTPEQLADIKAKAIDQLDKYSADPALVAKWHLTGTTGVSPVALHRLVLVFHGSDCVLYEEV